MVTKQGSGRKAAAMGVLVLVGALAVSGAALATNYACAGKFTLGQNGNWSCKGNTYDANWNLLCTTTYDTTTIPRCAPTPPGWGGGIGPAVQACALYAEPPAVRCLGQSAWLPGDAPEGPAVDSCPGDFDVGAVECHHAGEDSILVIETVALPTTPAVEVPLAVDANHPGGACGGSRVTTVSGATGTVYVDDRSDALTDLDQWVYLESNGIPGLQRGGRAPTGYADPCRESTNPDTLLY